MKAAQISQYGDAGVIAVNDAAATPAVGNGQVLIEVKAASLNPVDSMVRSGFFQQMAPLQFPATLGGDVAGVVVEVGSEVAGFKVGDEVYGTASLLAGGSGSFAQFATASAAAIAIKPKNVTFQEAASLPLTGVSALQALTEHLKLQPGQKILIHGGAGGIGTLAIQMAKHLGAYVATTVSKDDVGYAKSLGADQVINYKDEKFEVVLKDFDAVYDTVAGETYQRSFQVLAKGGAIVSMLAPVNTDLAQKYGVTAYQQRTMITSERLASLARLVEDGVVRPQVDKVFNLHEVGEAFKYRETGHPKGKVILSIG